jgi:hypothetical protein
MINRNVIWSSYVMGKHTQTSRFLTKNTAFPIKIPDRTHFALMFGHGVDLWDAKSSAWCMWMGVFGVFARSSRRCVCLWGIVGVVLWEVRS